MNKVKHSFVRRDKVTALRRVLMVLLFGILALAFCSIFIASQGFNPVEVYAKMFKSAFGSWKLGWAKSIQTGVPLMMCGLAVSIAFKMNLNNIGAEGQFAMGAIAAAGVALFWNLPGFLQIPVMIIVSILAGCAWALIAALLKAFWNINETIVTLMLNYVALLYLDYLCYGPWKNTTSLGLPYSNDIPETAVLPSIFGGISSSFILAIVMAVIMYLFFKYTTTGFQVSVIKNGPASARYAGINVRRNILVVLGISGALAGLTGSLQVSGVIYHLQPNIPQGAGYTGIVIAYLSKFNPLIVVLVAIFFGGLEKGAYAVQTMGVPSQLATMIRGAILIFVLASEFFTEYRLKSSKSALKEKEA
ncbi:MAG: ABC transporter permease [Lachnospiraceae bacterium]|nr:ABC transporter permease [Candidatus Equihabitans merdae]